MAKCIKGKRASANSMKKSAKRIRLLFEDAQFTKDCHERHAETLRDILEHDDGVAFGEFVTCLKMVLHVAKREPAVELIIDFAVEAISRGSARLLQGALGFLVSIMSVQGKGVRYRACQLAGRVLEVLPEDCDLDPELFDALLHGALLRLTDVVPAVRSHAARVLKRLQCPDEPDDMATAALMRAAATDSSKEVRRAALASITASRAVLPHLLERVEDAHPDVAAAAFDRVADQVNVGLLSTSERLYLLAWGLADGAQPPPAVQAASRRMLCGAWLPVAGYDPVRLVGLLDVLEDPTNERIGVIMLRTLLDASLRLRAAAADEDDVAMVALETEMGLAPDADAAALRDLVAFPAPVAAEMTFEAALFARLRVEAVTKDKLLSAAERERLVEEVLPDAATLCNYIETLSVADLENDDEIAFVARQLFELVVVSGSLEETGRRRLVGLLRALLAEVCFPDDLEEPCILALAKASVSERDFARLMYDIFNDLNDVITGSADASVIVGDTQNGYNAEGGGGLGGVGAKGGGEEDALAAEKRRHAAQIALLSRIQVVLQNTKHRWDDDGTFWQLERDIICAIDSNSCDLRAQGMVCLGKLCPLDFIVAQQRRELLLLAAGSAAEALSVRAAALQALSDASLAFGVRFVGMDGKVVGLLISLVNDRAEDKRLVAVAAEACGKLVLLGRLPPAVALDALAAIAALYFEPGTAADPATHAETFREPRSSDSSSDGESDSDGGSAGAAANRRAAGASGDGGKGGANAQVSKQSFGMPLPVLTLPPLPHGNEWVELGTPVRAQREIASFLGFFAVDGPSHRALLRDCVPRVLRMARERAMRLAADGDGKNGSGDESGTIDMEQVIKQVALLILSANPAVTPAAPGANVAGGGEGDEEGEASDASDDATWTDTKKQVKGKRQQKQPKKLPRKKGKEPETAAASTADLALLGQLAMALCADLEGMVGDTACASVAEQVVRGLVALPLPTAEQDTIKHLRDLVALVQRALPSGKRAKKTSKARAAGEGGEIAALLAMYAAALAEADLTPDVPLSEAACAALDGNGDGLPTGATTGATDDEAEDGGAEDKTGGGVSGGAATTLSNEGDDNSASSLEEEEAAMLAPVRVTSSGSSVRLRLPRASTGGRAAATSRYKEASSSGSEGSEESEEDGEDSSQERDGSQEVAVGSPHPSPAASFAAVAMKLRHCSARLGDGDGGGLKKG